MVWSEPVSDVYRCMEFFARKDAEERPRRERKEKDIEIN